MDLIFDENNIVEYMAASKQVDFIHPVIDENSARILGAYEDEIDKARAAYEFVRDEITHSWDFHNDRVTKTASEVLLYKEGTCYSKALLLAALLRHEGFAVGFCYQRVKKDNISASGYFLHGLNVVYLQSLKKWIRLDARGGKNGTKAEFSIDDEKLYYTISPEKDEVDFPTVFARPLRTTIDALENSKTCQEMIRYHLPANL